MNIFAPSNVGVIQKVVMLILTFEIIPDDLYRVYIWDWTETEDLDQKQQAVGLESRIFMLSMGLPFYLFAVFLLLLLIALMLTCVISCRW